MDVPSEIRKLLGDREPKAYASLSCSFHGPIGETHFVVANGQLFVFERESLIGDFAPVQLDAAHPPKLERGTFNDTLHVALADGAAHQLNVSSFDRDALEQVLLENAKPAATEAPPEAAPPPPNEGKSSDEDKLTSLFGDEPSGSGDGSESDLATDLAELQSATDKLRESASKPDSFKLIDIKKLADELDAASNTPEPKPEPPASEPDKEDEPDKQAGKEIAIYHGSDSGCIGCGLVLAVFAGAVVAFWFLHIEAARVLGIIGPDEVEDGSFTFIATKGLALVAGGYLGVRLAQLVGKILKKLNWTGMALFAHGDVFLFGQRSKWDVKLAKSRSVQCSLTAWSASEASHDSQGKPVKRGINYYLRVEQEDRSALLKTTHYSANPYAEIAGLPVARAPEEPQSDRLITFDYKTFKHLARRLSRLL